MTELSQKGSDSVKEAVKEALQTQSLQHSVDDLNRSVNQLSMKFTDYVKNDLYSLQQQQVNEKIDRVQKDVIAIKTTLIKVATIAITLYIIPVGVGLTIYYVTRK